MSTEPKLTVSQQRPTTTEVAASETNVTDIELMPDGRIFVFGTSLEVLDVLNQLQTSRDGEITARLQTCGQNEPPPTPDTRSPS